MTDREQIAADREARGFSCDIWTDPPGQRWEDFTHATDEVVIVLDGDMEFEVEGEVHHLEPGRELLIPAGAVHSARNIGSATAPESAVIAWLRHQTTACDNMKIARVKGKRREVRRMLAEESHRLLEKYRAGRAVREACPLRQVLSSSVSPAGD